MSAITPIEMNALAHAGQPAATAAREADVPRDYLSFRVGAEEYGIDILRVQEIRSYEQPLRFAGAPACVTGVLHLRGTIVPIVDLRLHLQAPHARHDAATVIVVLNLRGRVVGAVVDAVCDVTALRADEIKAAPQFNHGVPGARHVNGIAPVPGAEGDRMLILLDIESLMASPELGLAASL